MIKEEEMLKLIKEEKTVFWFNREHDKVKQVKLIRKLREDEYYGYVYENGYHVIKLKATGEELHYHRPHEFSHIGTDFATNEKCLIQQYYDEVEEYLLEDLYKTRAEVVSRFGYNKFKKFMDKWAFDSFEEFEKYWNKHIGETKC